MFLSQDGGLIKYDIEGAVLLFIFLNKMKSCAVLIGDASDAKSGKETEFHHAARPQRAAQR